MSQGSVTGAGTDSKFTAMNGDLDFVYDGKKEKRALRSKFIPATVS